MVEPLYPAYIIWMAFHVFLQIVSPSLDLFGVPRNYESLKLSPIIWDPHGCLHLHHHHCHHCVCHHYQQRYCTTSPVITTITVTNAITIINTTITEPSLILALWSSPPLLPSPKPLPEVAVVVLASWAVSSFRHLRCSYFYLVLKAGQRR